MELIKLMKSGSSVINLCIFIFPEFYTTGFIPLCTRVKAKENVS